MTFGIGGLAAIIAWVIGVSVNRPSAAKLATLGAAVQASGGPPTPEQQAEMARLRARLGSAGKAVASLLAITVVTMALARYLV